MDCRAFETWLDGGRPAALRDTADAHTAACPTCAALFAADAELELALETRFASSTPDFTDRVMVRVAAESSKGTLPIDPELLLPWWAQILREPAALVGLGIGALCAAWGPFVGPAARRATPALLQAASALGGRFEAPAFSPLLIVSLAAPLLGVAAWAIYRVANAAAARLSGVAP